MHVDGRSRELVLNSVLVRLSTCRGKTRFYNIVFGIRSWNSVLVRLSASRSNTNFFNIVFSYGSEGTVLAGGDVAGVKVSLNPEVPIELVFACVVIVDSITFYRPRRFQ